MPTRVTMSLLEEAVFTPDAILDYSSAGGPRAPYPEVKAWLAKGLSMGSPVRMDGDRADADLPPPSLGEHTDEILAQLQLGAGEAERLRSAGVIG